MEDRQDEPVDDLLERATEALRRLPVLSGPAPEAIARALEAVRAADIVPRSAKERGGRMKRIIRIAVAATILVGVGLVLRFFVASGSNNLAIASVADALDRLRSATYEVTSEGKGEKGQPPPRATGKGFFLAPSHQRIEMEVTAGPPKTVVNQVTVFDGQTAKLMMLTPSLKFAMSMDMKKIREDDRKKAAKGAPPDLFEVVRRLVREGSSGTGEKAERLGEQEIDGHKAVGFRVHANGMEMTLWADPRTAWPIRIDITMDMLPDVRTVMSRFRYDVELDPSLFSLEPPEGYTTQAMDVAIPTEEDLLRTLRTIAENSKGVFPAKLAINEDVLKALMAGAPPMIDKDAMEKMEAEFNRIAAKYGGKEKLRAKYGKNIPPEIIAEVTKAGMPTMQKQMQEQIPRMQKQMQGIAFYSMLKPENDPHYAGGGAKLGTPDRPILWYRPTGAEKYRVIYADLGVKEMTADEAKKLPGSGSPAKGQ